jgi:hypothetical protein
MRLRKKPRVRNEDLCANQQGRRIMPRTMVKHYNQRLLVEYQQRSHICPDPCLIHQVVPNAGKGELGS